MSEAEFAALLERVFWPLVVGVLAAFFYLALLAGTHGRARLLTQLCRNLIDRREKLQARPDRDAYIKVTARLRRTEDKLRELMKQEGLRAELAPKAPEKKT